jgi:LysM repeat protein
LTPTTTAQAIAQAFSPTPNPQQGTAQAILATISAQTLTAAAGSFQGVTPTGQTPFGQTPFAQTPQPFGATPSGFATVFPDCEYLIAPGDKLGNIARTYNVTIEQLIARNPEMIGDGGNLIKAGDTIWIPGCGRNPTATPTGTLTITPAFSGQGGQAAQDNSLGPIEYIVQAGDGIYKLSRVFNVTMAEILRANPQISNINLIIEGQKIIIPTRSQYPTPTPTPTLTLTPSF